MTTTTHSPAWLARTKGAVLGAALAVGLSLGTPQPASALTIMLNFVNATTTDRFGVTAIPETFASWGFTGLNLAGVRNATLAAVQKDYLEYPTVLTNPLSPLAAGKTLNIKFEISNGLTAPTNGDTEWYYMNIGDAMPNQGFLGQACLGCVRNSAGLSTVPNGTIFGSTLTDSIAGLLPLATNDQQRINLLAGTAAHEIGHALTLVHPSSALANPGESIYSVMATGAAPTSMPNVERIKDRAFAYTEYTQLITSVGVVPEPESALLLALGIVALVMRRQSVLHRA